MWSFPLYRHCKYQASKDAASGGHWFPPLAFYRKLLDLTCLSTPCILRFHSKYTTISLSAINQFQISMPVTNTVTNATIPASCTYVKCVGGEILNYTTATQVPGDRPLLSGYEQCGYNRIYQRGFSTIPNSRSFSTHLSIDFLWDLWHHKAGLWGKYYSCILALYPYT